VKRQAWLLFYDDLGQSLGVVLTVSVLLLLPDDVAVPYFYMVLIVLLLVTSWQEE
jgi:hypothetical protein